MKHIHGNVTACALALIALGFVAAVGIHAPLASARPSTDIVAQTTTETTDQTNETELSKRETVQLRVAELKAAAKQDVEKARESHKSLTEEKRKLVCENRQKAIENKLTAFNQAADKHLAKLDGVFMKLQDYQVQNNLPASNYTALVATATEKQTAATEAVAALKLVAADIDCSNPETVVKLSEVKTAANDTRKALHEYRMALKKIVVVLAQAKDGKSTSTDGDTTNAPTTTDTSTNTAQGEN